MLASLKGLLLTMRTTFRRPVTAQYPKEHLPIQPRYMGFPALTWDHKVGEPYCTACMVCVRNCPTQCMKATMKDNPLYKEGRSPRRKIVEAFEINLNRCILCGICVEVCNFDAIVMSYEHELSTFQRNGRRVNLQQLLEMGKRYQALAGWRPEAEIKAEQEKARLPSATAAAKPNPSEKGTP
ncbi:MAG: NuoI/complex I 23 kDa subunit family protein [Dehalococcoidia bacterium]